MPTKDEVLDRLAKITDVVVEYGKPILHIGFIPAILVLGMVYTEPRPSIVQLLAPM